MPQERKGSELKPLEILMTFREFLLPHYFFDIKDGRRVLDSAGADLKSDEHAIDRAKSLAIKVALETPDDDPKRHIAVLNQYGDEIWRVPIHSKQRQL
ncbi:MAG: hypothetical protein HY242_04785 [Afipia sp.]|nr:hypothetical protein [Afipia sp.]